VALHQRREIDRVKNPVWHGRLPISDEQARVLMSGFGASLWSKR
jgi:hypothetical protein